MNQTKLTIEEIDVLEEALTALNAAEKHFTLRDRANAALHMTGVRYSPITTAVGRASTNLVELIDRLRPETPTKQLDPVEVHGSPLAPQSD